VPATFRGRDAPPRVRIRAVTRTNRPPSRGLFITFEGIEGSGKTSQIARAAEWMKARGLPVLATRNPGGTELGVLLRDALLHSRGHIDAGAELLLMMADRRHHLATVIEPTLAAGTHVLCDRYSDASRAYQGAGRGLGEAAVDALHRAWCRRDPDRTYLLDLPVEVALARVAKRRGASYDRFEVEDRDFHERVRAAYLRRARKEPKRFVVIDASPSTDEVFLSLEENLRSLFPVSPSSRRRA
jgi:dTMP kinase